MKYCAIVLAAGFSTRYGGQKKQDLEFHGKQIWLWSYDTAKSVVGEDNIAEAVNELSRIPRVSVLVLAGSLMGGRIVDEIKKIKKQKDLTVISLNMPGSVVDVADLVVTDPIQAGVMAVMQIADTAVFDYNILKKNHRKF